MATHADTLTVACLECGAPPGQGCQPASGAYTYDRDFYTHKVRHQTFEASEGRAADMTVLVNFDGVPDSGLLGPDVEAVQAILGKYGQAYVV